MKVTVLSHVFKHLSYITISLSVYHRGPAFQQRICTFLIRICLLFSFFQLQLIHLRSIMVLVVNPFNFAQQSVKSEADAPFSIPSKRSSDAAAPMAYKHRVLSRSPVMICFEGLHKLV